MPEVIPLIPYVQRARISDGGCQRCGSYNIHVIESVEGGMLCWDLGECQMRRPFPKAKSWDRSMAEII